MARRPPPRGRPPLNRFDVGMIVFTRGLIAPVLHRVVDLDGQVASIERLDTRGAVHSVRVEELRRYCLRPSDTVTCEEEPAHVLAVVNPRDPGLWIYQIQRPNGVVMAVKEHFLHVAEVGFSPDPLHMAAQGDAAPWPLVSARQELIRSFFRATSRSVGMAGYTGARMLPIPHQLNAARYAILFGRVRFLLADEVGLGKTVEAGLIVSTLRKYFPHWRAAVFVPESLTVQWAFEMYGKFGKTVFCLDADEFAEDDPGIILPHDAAATFGARHEPEILVVDEAHRVLRDPRLYAALAAMSAKAHAVLLLTATPRADDATNLRRLLQLVDPEAYGALDCDADLLAALARQGRVEEFIQALRDPSPDMEALSARWRALGLADPEIDELLATAGGATAGAGARATRGRKGAGAKAAAAPGRKRAAARDATSAAEGSVVPFDPGDGAHRRRHILHHAAALVTDRYYPGARILRYQRKFLSRDNAMAIRVVASEAYAPSESEAAAVGAARAWIEAARGAGRAGDPAWRTAIATLWQATGSSPLALEAWLAARRGAMDPVERVTVDPVRLARATLAALPRFEGEEALLAALGAAAATWGRRSRPDHIAGLALAELPRYQALLRTVREALDADEAPHLLVFTGFEANVKALQVLLRRQLGGRVEVFAISAEQEWRERERAAFGFQECTAASILVTDELGGEGRNFQFVGTLVHFDLPPAAWLVEQRIGRCDRVGRDEELDVDSRVLVAEGGADEALFDFFAEGIGVFNDSIAPVESALDALGAALLDGFIAGDADGIRALVPAARAAIERARAEEEKDLLARSRVGVAEARRIADELNDADELAELRRAALRYARLFESMVDERPDGRVQVTVGEFHSLREHPGVRPEMIGYFSRREAVRHERLDFFSPGHPYVRGLALSALEESPDRVAFVRRRGVARPGVKFLFRAGLAPEFFEEVARLPTDLRPPLFCMSAAAFGTTLLPVAATFDGAVVAPDDPAAAAYLAPAQPGDASLDAAGPELLAALPEEWADALVAAHDAAYEQAAAWAQRRLESERDRFEDLLCEVLSRTFPTHEWLEKHVQAIMHNLACLTVEADSLVVMLPGS